MKTIMKSFYPILAIMAYIFIFPPDSNAQEATLEGHIYDLQTHEALTGANVMTPDTSATAISDDNGHFQINPDKEKGKLRVSMVGYKTQTVHYAPKDTHLDIQLKGKNTALDEVHITSYNSHKTNRETPGAISTISGDRIRQGNGASLQSGLNSVPGVKMDQSTLSESRISMRGSGIRADWGIRNIKVYINDIPVTETDGTTRIEALNVSDLGKAEIIKGPASSIYGGGTTGGVINFKLQQSDYQEQSLEASGLVGSYGLKRSTLSYRGGTDNMNSYISYGWQEMDSYREHSNDLRHFLTGNFQFNPSEKQEITLLFNHSSQDTQIPGALSKEEVEDNRRQATAENLEKRAGRKQKWTRLGVGQKYDFSPKFSNSTSVFTYFYDLDHPLSYAYLRNDYQSYGGRTKFTYKPSFDQFDTKFTVGAEYNHSKTKGAEYVNDHGKEGDVMTNTDYKNTYYTVFYQSVTDLTANLELTAGLSLNGLTYDSKNYLDASQSGKKKFDTQVSPRIALSYNFSDALSLHGSFSRGFAPPTTSEIQNVDGTINTDIGAEKATNYEINAKGNMFNSRLSYGLALFKMNMKGELIGQTVQQNITIYNNSGKTKHDGIELALAYRAIDENDNKAITLLRPHAAITYSHFRFKDYKNLDEDDKVKADFSGNKLTGIPPWTVNIGLDFETKPGFYFNGSFDFNDRLPLNDANTDYNSAYGVLNGKIGLKKRVLKYFDIDIYAGLDNITDNHYSSFTELNAASYGNNSPAYFNPSPGINGYGGLKVKYNFK